MQMYRVQFIVTYQHVIDKGDILVCAGSNELARAMVLELCKLPASRTRIEATRVRPSFFELARQEIPLNNMKSSARNHGDAHDQPSPSVPYKVQVSTMVRASDEEQALRRVAAQLKERGNEKRTMGPVEGSGQMFVECTPLNQGAPRGMEAVETYKPKTFIGGVRSKGEP
jgi:hypothetical protein